jgi:hypothetical protein
MKVYSTPIYLKILIYNWSKLKKVDFLGSENVFYFGTEGVCACEVRNTIRATKNSEVDL